jgi:hypothetical protein
MAAENFIIYSGCKMKRFSTTETTESIIIMILSLQMLDEAIVAVPLTKPKENFYIATKVSEILKRSLNGLVSAVTLVCFAASL